MLLTCTDLNYEKLQKNVRCCYYKCNVRVYYITLTNYNFSYY